MSYLLIKNKIFKNYLWLLIEKFFALVIGVIITSQVAKHFGPNYYGIFNYSLSFVGFFTILSTLGLPNLTVQSLINKIAPENEILFSTFVIRFIGGIFLTIFAYFSIILIENDKLLISLVLITSSTMIFRSFEVIEYWIQTYQLFKILSILKIIALIFSSILKLLLILIDGNLQMYAMIYFIDSLVIGLLLFYTYLAISRQKFTFKFNLNYALHILKKSSSLIFAGFLVTLYMQIDKFMLGFLLPSKIEVGIYSAAVSISQMWYFIPLSIITIFQPMIIKMKNENSIDSKKLVNILYLIVFYVGLIFALTTSFFSSTIVSILYGSNFKTAEDILLISSWTGIFATLGSARTVWLISEYKQHYNLYFSALGVTTNIILNLFFIPTLRGHGAAIATLITQILISLFFPLLFSKTRISTLNIFASISPKNVYYLIRYGYLK